MVDEAEVFRIADAIVADSRNPTQREIRELLNGGGSFRDIGPAFVAWLTKEGFRPRATKNSVPELLVEKLRAAAAEIWADGRRQGALIGQNDIARLTVERDAARLAHEEMSAKADELQRRLDGAPDPGGAARPEGRKATIEFWSLIMQEIAELLKGRELRADQIVGLLSKTTLQLAHQLRERGGAGLLASKMRYFAKKGRYFATDDGVQFRRMAEG